MSRTPSVLSLALLVACGGAPAPSPTHPPAGSGSDDAGPTADAPRRPLSMGESRATLTAEDPTNDGQAHYHVWRIELDGSQRVRIRMSSAQVDPLIEVRGPGEQHLRNDDAFPGMLDAMVDFVPSQAGTYEIWTTTYAAGQTGDYTLHVEGRPPAGVGQPLALGGEAASTLGRHGQPGLPGSWLHFEGRAGSIVRLRVTSSAFDTIATLIGPGGQTWLNDDANDLGPDGDERALDSTVVAALPQSGTYHLVVTPYGRGAGPFAVRTQVRPPVLLAEDGSRPEGLAGPEGGGRVLGVYAGITDYPHHGDLYGCADDARLLAEAMRAAHLQDESDQLVLPDGLATRDNFLSGIAQMARRAEPEDVVMVFFSGHGQQVADEEGGDELDDLDETLVLHDGSITDDDLVQALSSVGAGTVILAVDACHSGGFADDWVRRPGRMGIFSSDEDVLSDTAEPHRAGGYLSWHLRRGVLGEADSRPRDGVLHAGELTDYLNDGFIADHARMNPASEPDRAQRLVVRRGAVTWDDLLWVYPRHRDLSLPPLPDLPLTSPPPR
ncbi:MAG TPA: caspase family protein [Sandaracinaceae bacterium LLY-WYZ-13_1]|nr:caspase family protein [Sandaracinaceae bacterium LLY-WYZ-13_1]